VHLLGVKGSTALTSNGSGAHDVRLHQTGRKHFHHPVMGDLHLNQQAMARSGLGQRDAAPEQDL
jgi:transcription regulator MmyB-like protein